MSEMYARSVAVWMALVCLVTGAVAREPAVDPRALPSLVEVWQLSEPAEEMMLASGTLYVLGEKSVMALDARTGSSLWRQTTGERECCDPPFAVFGEVVALGDNERLTLLDRRTGKPKAEVELPGNVVGLYGMPLVAELIDDAGGYALAVIDVGSGAMAAHLRFSGSIDEVAMSGETLVVSLEGSGEGLQRFEGYDAGSLALRWTVEFPAYSGLKSFDGRLWVDAIQGECDGSSSRPLDLRTGELGPALKPLPERGWGDSNFPEDFQFDEIRPGGAGESEGPAGFFVLYRVAPQTATEQWKATLPGRPRAPLHSAERVAVPVSLDAGRGLLAVLKASTGEIEQVAFGLPVDSWRFVMLDDLLVVLEPAGLHAYALDRFGAPERETRSIAAEVERILIGPGGGDQRVGLVEPRSQVAELTLLGEAACPEVAKRLARMAPSSLAAAAVFIQTTRCRGSAPALAAVLGSMSLSVEESGWPEWTPPLAVLRALGAVGTAIEVPVLERVAVDPGLDSSARAEAWMALVAVGGAGLERALHVLGEASPPQRSELDIPSPMEILALVGKPEIEEAFPENPEDRDEYYRRSALRRAARGSAALTLSDGTRLVLYRGATIGGERDLWLAQTDAAGNLSAGPWFTGESLPDDVKGSERLSLQGSSAKVALRGERGQLLFTFDRATLARDSDRDGLTDLVELRLHLDPTNPDSDADTLLDAVDPAPNAAGPRALSVEERQELDLFEQLFGFILGPRASKDRAAMIVWRDGSLEWRGRTGPTLTLPKAGWEAFLEAAGTDGIAHLTFDLRKSAGHLAGEPGYESCRPENEGEAVYDFSLFRGGLNAVSYCAVLRPAGGRWLIRRLVLTSIS